MPEYLAPGVFVEEISFRSKSIEGVGTSVAAIAGPTRFGPVRGAPEVITSYGEYERIYGDPGSLTFGAENYLNYTALAARAFFENGGKQLYVSRVINGGNDTDTNGGGSSAGTATAVSDGGAIRFNARFPGSGGNFDVEVVWMDAQNLLKSRNYSNFAEIPVGAIGLLTIEDEIDVGAITTPGAYEPDNYPLSTMRVLATKTATGFEFLEGSNAAVINATPLSETVSVESIGAGVAAAALDDVTINFRQVYAAQPTAGALNDGTPAELMFNSAVDIQELTGLDLGTDTVIRGTLNADGLVFTTSADVEFNLAALAVAPNSIKSLKVQREFALNVIRRKTTVMDTVGTPGKGEPVYSIAGLSLDSTHGNFIGSVLVQNPDNKVDELTQPIACVVSGSPSAADLHEALINLFEGNDAQLNPGVDSFDEPRYIITLANGSDGNLPIAIDYAGETDEIQGSTGLAALEEIEDISIVMTPAAAADEDNHQAVVAELQKHCVKMRYRMGLVDSRDNMSLSEVRTFRDNFDDSRLALYSPWVVVSDPTGVSQTISVPPSGFMAGIYARTDVERGVHKAPANTPVLGALRFNQEINKFQQELLNPNGINCLRSFAGRGHRVWGGRTLSSDPEWKYVNVRRYFLYLERSIDKGTQWAVFEPNGEKLWANVVTTVDSFLFNEWKNGRLLGGKPASAYFVRCDRSTMTQNDIDNGRLVCEVGVAPLHPAEFVVFRIGQKTADA